MHATPDATPTPAARGRALPADGPRAARATKGLRIGILTGGQLVEERFVRPRGDVTFGPASRDTFIVPLPGSSSKHARSLTLFSPDGDGYSLHLVDNLDGRVALGAGDRPLSLAELRGVAQSNGGRTIRLGEGARGRIAVGDVTVLFQVVRAPAEAPRPRLPRTLRGTLAGNLDWVMIAIVGISLFSHTAFVLYLRHVDFPRRPDIGEIPERVAGVFQRMPRFVPPPEKPKPETPDKPTTTATGNRPPRRPSAGGASVASRPGAHDPAAQAALNVEARRAAMRLITAVGEGGAASDVLSRPGISGDADAVFREVGGTTVASRGDDALAMRGSSTSGTRRTTGGVRALGGPVEVASGDREKERRADLGGFVKPDKPIDVDPSDPGCRTEEVARQIKQRLGGIVACYERRLHHDSGIGGKVQVRFTISAEGRVTRAEIEDDTIGDPQLAGCVMARVRGWHFGDLGCGEVQFSYPFLFVRNE